MAELWELIGVDIAQRLLGVLPSMVLDAAGHALLREADAIMDASKTAYVPVLTGSLRDTGAVSDPSVEGQHVSVVLSYGGPSSNGTDVDYAVIVHEDMAMPHPRGGQAKFLEAPLFQAVSGMIERLGMAIKAEMR